MSDVEKWLSSFDAMIRQTKRCTLEGLGGTDCENCPLYVPEIGCSISSVLCTHIKDLHAKLLDWGIPHDMRPLFGGYQIAYPDFTECTCSAITHRYSYGQESGLIEIRGLLTPEEGGKDDVCGYLTADDVFKRIKTHWEENRYGTAE